MISPNKERFLSEKKRLEMQIGKFNKDNIPVKLSNRLKFINEQLAIIKEIQKTTDPAKGLDDTEYAIMGD
jgi:hypothetical protein